AEPPSVALAIAKRSDYSHSYLSSQRRTPAHGCRPPRQAPGTRPGACGHQSRQMSLPLGQDSDRAVIAVRPEPLIRLVGLARPVRCRHPADVAGGAGRLVQMLRQSVASRIGDFPARRKGRFEVAMRDGDEAAEFLGRAFRRVVDVESDGHCFLLGAYLPRRMGCSTSCYGPHYTDRGTD